MVQNNYEYKYFICVILAMYELFFTSKNLCSANLVKNILFHNYPDLKKTKTKANLTNGLDKGTEEVLLWCDLQMLIISMFEV